MGSWVNLLVAAVPPAVSAMMFLASDGIEHTRMKHCLDIYGKAKDDRTRTYLAEAIRAEAWKADRPLIWRHPTMNVCVFTCFAFFYFYMAFFMSWQSHGEARISWHFVRMTLDFRFLTFAIFFLLGLVSVGLAVHSLHSCKKVLPSSGEGDFSHIDVIPLDDIHALSTEELRQLLDCALRQIQDETVIKEEIERKIDLLESNEHPDS